MIIETTPVVTPDPQPVIAQPNAPDSLADAGSSSSSWQKLSNFFSMSCRNGGVYSMWRKDCGPTQYVLPKTPVTVDVLEMGLIFAICIIAISLLAIVLGTRGKNRKWFFPLRCFIGLYVLTSVILCNFGQEWEVSELSTKTPYRAGIDEEIHAHIGVKIGLRSINITLKSDPEIVKFKNGLQEERINHNERFSWNNMGWGQGRNGFGPYAGRYNQEFRAAQRRGSPLPILWIAEYFTLDGEDIRWGRHYRTAGWYAHIMMWSAFPMWILSMMLFYMVISYAAYCCLFTGILLGTANLIFHYVRNPLDIDGVIPFEDGRLYFHYGWCFWMNLVTAFLCITLGIVVYFMNIFCVNKLAAFLGIDVQQEYEDVYVEVPTDLDVGSTHEDVVDDVMLRSLSRVSAMSSNSEGKPIVYHYQRRRATNGSLILKYTRGRRPTLQSAPWYRDSTTVSTPASADLEAGQQPPLRLLLNGHAPFSATAPTTPKKSSLTPPVGAAMRTGGRAAGRQVNWNHTLTGFYDNVDVTEELKERLMRQRGSVVPIYEEHEMEPITDVEVNVDSNSETASLKRPLTGDSLPASLPPTPNGHITVEAMVTHPLAGVTGSQFMSNRIPDLTDSQRRLDHMSSSSQRTTSASSPDILLGLDDQLIERRLYENVAAGQLLEVITPSSPTLSQGSVLTNETLVPSQNSTLQAIPSTHCQSSASSTLQRKPPTDSHHSSCQSSTSSAHNSQLTNHSRGSSQNDDIMDMTSADIDGAFDFALYDNAIPKSQ